jgi:hypothetical protein
MAWNTRINYTATDTIGTGFANGIGNDLRTWGSNVNAGGYNLSNLGTVVTAGPVDVTSPIIARPTTTPGTPGVSSEGVMYVKGGKLIVQYNDAAAHAREESDSTRKRQSTRSRLWQRG